MIPAGTLRYKLKFHQLQEIQSESGFKSKIKTEIYQCKAAKIKSTGDLIEDGKELFNSNRLIFKLRNNNLLNENLIVEFDGVEYKIVFFDFDIYDSSIKITIEKINK